MTNSKYSDPEFSKELERLYGEKRPALGRAKARLGKTLREVIGSIEDRELVRAELRSVRIKEFESFRAKVLRKGWSACEALSVCSDLVGGRVVCNNVEDVRRFAELLIESGVDARPLVDEQDHMHVPDERGYRALHLDLRLNVGKHPLRREIVPCEVQVRTRLQDAWAELSHGDIYKQANLPEDLEARARDLAEVLAAADRIASRIRSRALRERRAPSSRPDMDRVSEAGLSYMFKEYFGRSPADYAVRQAMDVCRKLDIRSLKDLPDYLDNPGNEGFPEDVRIAYASLVGAATAANEMVFVAALRAMASGKVKALKWVRHKGRREVAVYDRSWACDVHSDLPDNIANFVRDMRDCWEGSYIEEVAEALGATGACYVCRRTVVDPFAFTAEVTSFYKVSEEKDGEYAEQLEQILLDSSAETGGGGGGSLCAAHKELMQKED